MTTIRRIALLICLAPIGNSYAVGSDWYLKISVADPAGQPVLTIGNEQSNARFDSQDSLWRVPLRTNGPSFAVPYVIDTSDGDVIAVRLEVPTRGIKDHASVLVGPPKFNSIDERSIRDFWSTNRITKDPSDEQLQFQYLQDLIFVVKVLKSRQQEDATITINSANVRASYLLLQVVRNLAEHTWFVIDPSSKSTIDWAVDVVQLSADRGYACDWLRLCGKKDGGVKDLELLLKTVRSIGSQHATRMYATLVPNGRTLDTRFCDDERVASMSTFLDYLVADRKQRIGPNGVDEIRVVNDIAACRAVRAQCVSTTREAALSELQIAKNALNGIDEGISVAADARRSAIDAAIVDVTEGKQVICPVTKRQNPSIQ